MASPDLSLLSTQFRELGAPVFGKKVVEWDLRNQGIQVRTNVTMPQALVKLSAQGGPRPYREQDDFGNGPQFTERILTVNQTKQDWTFNPENFRNTILADTDGAPMPFWEMAVGQMSKEFLSSLMLNGLYGGTYNASGTTPAACVTGWGTIIAAEIAASNLIPVTGADITTSNAVAQVELVKNAVPVWMKQMGFTIYCSYSTFEKYATNYRTVNGFKFEPRITGDYPIDNSLAILKPVAWMGTSQRLIATIDNNLVLGTNVEAVSIYSTPYLDYLKNRITFPVGCQIQDLDAIVVSDQA
ncbi:hypothetical protein ACFOW1_01710 [Parasediminibacterium paludis]|uniref:Phage major capsid protein n=1 Tax=Parasediminibacterium paludis TaxID=908966 RepID=A0ABV8PTW8_9BACT